MVIRVVLSPKIKLLNVVCATDRRRCSRCEIFCLSNLTLQLLPCDYYFQIKWENKNCLITELICLSFCSFHSVMASHRPLKYMWVFSLSLHLSLFFLLFLFHTHKHWKMYQHTWINTNVIATKFGPFKLSSAATMLIFWLIDDPICLIGSRWSHAKCKRSHRYIQGRF